MMPTKKATKKPSKKLAKYKPKPPLSAYSELFVDLAKVLKVSTRKPPTGADDAPDDLDWGLWHEAESDLILDIKWTLQEYVAKIQKAYKRESPHKRRGPKWAEVEAACDLLGVKTPNEGNSIPTKEMWNRKSAWIRDWHPDMHLRTDGTSRKPLELLREKIHEGMAAYAVLREYNHRVFE